MTTEPRKAFAIAGTVAATCAAFCMYRKRREALEREKLVKEFRNTVDSKDFDCLKLNSGSEDTVLHSATETKLFIDAGKLDPAQNVVLLAKRCRIYGRNRSRANAVAEETYDEVRKSCNQKRV